MQLALILAQAAPAATAGAFSNPQTYVAVATPLLTLLLAAFIAKVKPKMSGVVLAAIVTTLGTVLSALGTVVIVGTGGINSTGTVALTAGLSLLGVLIKVAVDKLGTPPTQ